MRIGMFGGTFDPPHHAHIRLARWVKEQLSLDIIYFIPAAYHAFKNNIYVTPAEIRYRMICAAAEGDAALKVSRIELDRTGVSFTVDTLRDFMDYEKISESQLFYIIGIDNLYDFHRWKDPDVILELATVVVIRRSGSEREHADFEHHHNIIFLDSPIIDISSTQIRDEIKSGIYDESKIPQGVIKLIKEMKLYRNN